MAARRPSRGRVLAGLAYALAEAMADGVEVAVHLADGAVRRGRIVRRWTDPNVMDGEESSTLLFALDTGGPAIVLNRVSAIDRG